MTRKVLACANALLVIFCFCLLAFPQEEEAVQEQSADYTIVEGDTLWDISAAKLGDPLLWPQIWKLNPYVTDPHWIYPGNTLVLPQSQVEMATSSQGITEEYVLGDELSPEELAPAPPEPKPLASYSQMQSAGFISPRAVDEFFGCIVEAEELMKAGLEENDIVYIDKGSADGIFPGDEFFVIHQGDKVFHPKSNDYLGFMYSNRGKIKVLCVQEHSATSKIIECYDAIARGDYIEPYEDVPAPTALSIPKSDFCEPAKGEIEGCIVASKDDMRGLAYGNIIYIDKGIDDGVAPGDMFVSFKIPRNDTPKVYTGEMVVLRTEKTTSTALIYRSRFSIAIGDYIKQK